jgi:hypothetical protein
VKFLPSTVGAEPKKVAMLAGFLVVAGVVWWFNSGPSTPATSYIPQKTSPLSGGPVAPVKTVAPRPPSYIGIRPMDDFKPSLKPPEGIDISKIDPTLKLDLLAKLNKVGLDMGTRGSVFDWGKAPPPPPPPPVKIPVGPMPATAQNKKADPPAPPKPAEPPPPPIPLKFYGFSTHSGAKRAFFLDGDDIDVAGENEIIKNRYKVIKIGVNSVEMEDLNDKHQQTLPLIAELAG